MRVRVGYIPTPVGRFLHFSLLTNFLSITPTTTYVLGTTVVIFPAGNVYGDLGVGMRQTFTLVLIALLATASVVWATDPPPATGASTDAVWQEYSLEAALTELEVDYGLWLEVTLSGVEPEVNRLEKTMMDLVNFDIYISQEKVRELAKETAEQSWREKRDTLVQKTNVDDSLQAAIARLNTKEALYRSIKKTGAFSNKYRLLGDYINLLRRELELPRLKLANEKVSDPSTGVVESSVPK
jgi:hypothetical protein